MACRCTCAPLSDVHSPIGTDRPRSAFKTTLQGAGSKRYVTKPSITARELKVRSNPLQLDDALDAGLKAPIPFEHSIVPLGNGST